MSLSNARFLLISVAAFVVADTAFLTWVVHHPDPYGADFRIGFGVLPLLLLGAPWSCAYFFAGFADEDSTTYPLWLGLAAMVNIAIAWGWARRMTRAST